MQNDNGGPAFPNLYQDLNGQVLTEASTGLSILDYFAANAVSGMMAGINKNDYRVNGGYLNVSGIARDAYDIAVAMVKARGEVTK